MGTTFTCTKAIVSPAGAFAAPCPAAFPAEQAPSKSIRRNLSNPEFDKADDEGVFRGVDTRRLNDLFRQRRLPAALDIARLPHRSPDIPVRDNSAALPAVAVVATAVRPL